MRDFITQTIKNCYQDMFINDILDPKQGYSIRIKENYNTACWSFEPPHNIFVGDKILDNIADKHSSMHYIESFLYHEIAHSLWTERDIVSINDACIANDIPFTLFNLLEDARIEEKMRLLSKRKFKWTDFEDVNLDTNIENNPQMILFQMIQTENNYPNANKDVEDFYNKVVSAKNSWEVLEVCILWIEKYPNSKEDSEEINDNLKDNTNHPSMSDMSSALEMSISSTILENAKNASTEIVNTTDTKESIKELVSDNGEFLKNFTSHNYFEHSTSVEIEGKIVKQLSPIFKKLLKSKQRKYSTNIPSKRLNIKAISSGRIDKIYKVKKEEGRAKKSINLIIDCSGSMRGLPLSGAATFTSLLSSLAKENLLQGHIILSSSYGYQSFKLPISNETIKNHFHTKGSEGLANTMTSNLSILKKGDLNLVFTDGLICDKEIDRSFFHSKGIYTFGCYVGDPNFANLSKWFDKSIARKSLHELISEMTIKIKQL